MNINLTTKTIIFFCFLFIQTGCTSNQIQNTGNNNFSEKPLIVFDDKEDGWGGDIRLSIISTSENDTSKVYRIVSKYKDKHVGLQIFISKSSKDNKGFGNSITLKSIGNESDDFLKMLALLYQQKIAANSKFVNSVSTGYVDLKDFAKSVAGKSDDTDPDTNEYKLFFESKQDEGEMYLNINDKDNWIEFREKDEEYRPVIIKMLTHA